jgi:hypothetical protein
MEMFSVESVVFAWDNQLSYALALLSDLTDEHMVLRPGGKMNHPAWILGHIGSYHGIVVHLLAGEAFDDPKNDRVYGFAGQGPVDDLSVYGNDLLLHHESLHIGQLSIWRRAAGLPAVELSSRTVRTGLVERAQRALRN